MASSDDFQTPRTFIASHRTDGTEFVTPRDLNSQRSSAFYSARELSDTDFVDGSQVHPERAALERQRAAMPFATPGLPALAAAPTPVVEVGTADADQGRFPIEGEVPGAMLAVSGPGGDSGQSGDLPSAQAPGMTLAVDTADRPGAIISHVSRSTSRVEGDFRARGGGGSTAEGGASGASERAYRGDADTQAGDRSIAVRGSTAGALDASAVEDIFSLARHGRAGRVQELMVGGVPSDIRDGHGNSVLHIACQNGLRKVAKAALRMGCDINGTNFKGNTPLHFCFAYGFTDLGSYLQSKGASTTVRNGSGLLPEEGIA